MITFIITLEPLTIPSLWPSIKSISRYDDQFSRVGNKGNSLLIDSSTPGRSVWLTTERAKLEEQKGAVTMKRDEFLKILFTYINMRSNKGMLVYKSLRMQ